MAAIATTLEIASRQLWSLMLGRLDPFLEVELGYLAEQLTTAQSKVRDASNRLADVEQGGDTRLADDLAVVQERIQTSTNHFRAIVNRHDH